MKKIIFISIIIGLSYYFIFSNDEIIIPENAIRFRVIANSNSKVDQDIKYLVRDSISSDVLKAMNQANSIDDVRNLINSNMESFENTIFSTLKNNNISQSFDISYGQHFFPEKIYNGVKYKEGNYESLVVTMGDGMGDNWWCVLFPPLCLLEAQEETETDDVEYKFFIKEIIDKYF